MRKWSVRVVMVICFLGLFSAGLVQAEVIRWRAQSAFSRGDFSADLLPSFAEEVKKKSDGRLLISTHYAGDLVPQDDTMKATSQNIIQMSQACGVFWSGEEPILGMEYGLPFAYKGTLAEVEGLIAKTGLYDLWQQAYTRKNNHLLGVHTYGPYPAIVSNKPLRTVGDFKGLKIRALLEVAELMKLIGAAPGYVPGGEVYMALKLGTFDAATYSVDAVRGFKWHEVMDYYILPYWCDWYFGDVIINMDEWKKLPDDLKKILEEAMVNYGKANEDIYTKEVQLVVEKAAELGYEVITMPEEEVAKIRQVAIEKIWPEYAKKSPECAQAIEAIMKYHGVK
ncbi:MAG: TRAP transporter substrate-binding protein DctP [Thermodesulfobacteriota bacterium]